MLIKAVELYNIKSFGGPGTHIGFRPGVNLIWGQNGSGKTTILEAVGYALFGALDYRIEQFKREGTLDGEVVVTLEARDGRIYEVIRSLKGTGKLEIIDVETKIKLTSKRKDTEDWLADNLGVEHGGYEKRLFENCLGVAQGKMTGSFLESDTARKAIFAPILRVDEYELAWKNLSATSSEIASRLTKIREDVARLEGRLQELPGKEAQKADWDKRIVDTEADLGSQKKAHKKQSDELNHLKDVKIKLSEAKLQLDAVQRKLDLLEAQVKNAERDLQQAKDAVIALETNKMGYIQYQEATRIREELLAQQRIFQLEKDKLAEIERRIAEAKTSINNCIARLDGIREAENKIVELELQVQQQTQLEQAIITLTREEEEYQRLLKQVENTEKSIGHLETQLTKAQLEVEKRAALEEQLSAQQSALVTLQGEIEKQSGIEAGNQQKLRDLSNQRATATTKANTLKIVLENTHTLQNEREEKKKQIEDVKLKIQERRELGTAIDALLAELQSVRNQQATASSNAEIFRQKIEELDKRLLLFGEVETAECPICKTPLDAHKTEQIEREFAQERINFSNQAEEAKLQIEQYAQKAKELTAQEKNLRKQQERLPIDQRLIELQEELSQKEKKLTDLNEQSKSLAGAKELAEQVEAQYQILLTQVETERKELREKRLAEQGIQGQVDSLNRELSKLAQVERVKDLEDRLIATRNDRDQAKLHSEALSGSSTKLAKTHSQLSALKDPRSTQNRCRGIASARAQVETEQAAQEIIRVNLETERQNQTQELRKYADLDTQLASVQTQLQETEPAYRTYLANEKNAAKHDELLILLNTLQSQLADQMTSHREVEGNFLQIQQTYDPAYHQKVEQENQETLQRMAALNASLVEVRGASERLEGELQQLYQQKALLRETCVQQDKIVHIQEVFKFARDGIRLAGPKVVQQRVKAISHTANRIFQEIIGDPSLNLIWDETYAIKIQHRKEARDFKQLSGGEQMAGAIAVRLAILYQMSKLRILFLDEPTANMDDVRRENLADRITGLDGLKQIFVITHDDAFRRDTHHVIQVKKENNVSLVTEG